MAMTIPTSELFALSKAYPIISVSIGAILFFLGLKVAAKLLKWTLWVLAAIAVIVAIILFFR